MQTFWKINKPNYKKILDLAYDCEIPLKIAYCYFHRGFDTKEKVESFLDTNLNKLHDPLLLPDMQKALDRINKAIDNNENIHVHGDYDVDGITSTAIIVYAFRKMSINNLSYYTPHRIEDGYDIKPKHVDKAKDNNVSLLLSVDCGIKAFAVAKRCKELDIDLIITDHHLPQEDGQIPEALAIINPNRLDSTYPFESLAGCGIAFKLVLAIAKSRGYSVDELFNDLLDFVTMGTVADVAPLLDENRIFVQLGCNHLLHTDKVGIQELFKVANVKSDIDTTTIGFYLGPRINAIGRLSDSMTALQLLLEEDRDKCVELAKSLNSANQRRQQLLESNLQEAEDLIKNDLDNSYVIMTNARTWQPGVVGLIAGRLTERYGRATMIGVELDDGTIKGSCRSIFDFPIIDALNKYKDMFISYGGHAMAAGFHMTKDNFNSLKILINEYAKEYFSEDYKPSKVIPIDAKLEFSDVNLEFYYEMIKMAPFGNSNAEPIFALYNVKCTDIKPFGKDNKYLRFKVRSMENDYKYINTIWWKRDERIENPQEDAIIDIAFKIKKDSYLDKEYIVLNIEDVKIK